MRSFDGQINEIDSSMTFLFHVFIIAWKPSHGSPIKHDGNETKNPDRRRGYHGLERRTLHRGNLILTTPAEKNFGDQPLVAFPRAKRRQTRFYSPRQSPIMRLISNYSPMKFLKALLATFLCAHLALSPLPPQP